MKPPDVLAAVCELTAQQQGAAAGRLLTTEYPGAGRSSSRSRWPPKRALPVFVRDGFTDRYFGGRLVFPGTLLALHVLLGDAFPYHPNWKQDATHPAFWELYPTIDHVTPLALGGADDESNVVTTSMLHNSAKANWRLEDLGWPVPRAPVVSNWDGLLAWFFRMFDGSELLRDDSRIRRWHRAASLAQKAGTIDGPPESIPSGP